MAELTMMRFRKDDRVSHARFGPGVVIVVDERYTIIEFDEAGVRKFVTALVQLERSELPLPVKSTPVRRRRRRVTGDSNAVQEGKDGRSASQKRHN